MAVAYLFLVRSMRIKPRSWVLSGIVAPLIIVAAVPIVHRLEFAHGDVVIQGFCSAWGASQGFHHAEMRARGGELVARTFSLQIGPFEWDLELNYFHS